MASNRKPVWLEENAHLTIKQYAKFIKKSMTDATSQLVLDHIGDLDEDGVMAAPAVQPPVQAKTPTPAAVAASPAKTEKPAAPRPKRERRHDGPRYLGGIWLV